MRKLISTHRNGIPAVTVTFIEDFTLIGVILRKLGTGSFFIHNLMEGYITLFIVMVM